MTDLVILTGPSGVGKSTILSRVLPEFPNVGFSVSWTTRDPRPGEVDGRDYHFVTKPDFLAGVWANAFLEHAEVFGNYYGTRAGSVFDRSREGKTTLLDIDPQGCRQVHDKLARWDFTAVWVTILPPDEASLYDRLKARAATTGETEEIIMRRLRGYPAYLEVIEDLGCFTRVVNHDLDQATEQFRAVLRGL